MIISCYHTRPQRIFLLNEEDEKQDFLFFKKILLWGLVWVATSDKVPFKNDFLNFRQPLLWNNIERRKWRESWSAQMEVGILLGTLSVNRPKIHSYLVEPHHASLGGIEIAQVIELRQ